MSPARRPSNDAAVACRRRFQMSPVASARKTGKMRKNRCLILSPLLAGRRMTYFINRCRLLARLFDDKPSKAKREPLISWLDLRYVSWARVPVDSPPMMISPAGGHHRPTGLRQRKCGSRLRLVAASATLRKQFTHGNISGMPPTRANMRLSATAF